MPLRPSCQPDFVKPFAGLLALGLAVLASPSCRAQSALPAGITLSTMAEVEIKPDGAGRRSVELAAADHVVAGDQLIYTVEIHNATARALAGIVVTNPIPERMGYVAASAQGPGAEIDFSVDGGMSFAKPDALTIKLAGGLTRPATAAEYTHIRWKLKYALSANSTAFARFRASLK